MTQTLLSPAPANGRKTTFSLPRASIDHIVEFSRHLTLADRALIEGVYVRGMSPAELARAGGLESGTIRRRLKRVVERMASPLFRFVIRHKQDWPEDRVAIAEAVILRGQSQRSAARTLNIGIHRVRREIDRIQVLADASDSSRTMM